MAWPEFLAAVDGTPPGAQILPDAATFFHAKCGLATPDAAAGITQTQLVAHAEYPEGMALRAFLARTLKAVNGAYEASLMAPVQPNFSQGAGSPSLAGPTAVMDVALQGQLQNVLGSNANAATLAEALAASAPPIAQLLKDAQLDDLPFHLIPSSVVFRALLAEVKQAADQGRVAYVYIDMTSREILPLWMPEEAVGGRLVLPGSLDGGHSLNADATGAQAMEALITKALRAMATHPRFFRSMPQWMACVQRFHIAAIATNMLTRAQCEAHSATVLRLAESTPTSAGGIHFATLYDELFRRHLALRAQRADPTLDILKESSEPS
ncbi:hypothetical protein N9L68_05045, partial [bacterium]|nr:hypothetical protein [bacterium]